ncbi:Uncharacterised protein [Burkholderia pseudomallei]|nr:Uncharacterised protein [Burkholderia pseudomallei]
MKKSQLLSLCAVIIAAPHVTIEFATWICPAIILVSRLMDWRGE